jgi:hypothetical protein
MDCYGQPGRDLQPMVVVNVQLDIWKASCDLDSGCVNYCKLRWAFASVQEHSVLRRKGGGILRHVYIWLAQELPFSVRYPPSFMPAFSIRIITP